MIIQLLLLLFTVMTPINVTGRGKKQTLEALELLKTKAPDFYKEVSTYIKVIKGVEKGSGMEAFADPPTFLAGDKTRDYSPVWYAGCIVHDTVHSKLYHEYLRQHPGKKVPARAWMGKKSEGICIDQQIAVLQKLNAPQHMIDHANRERESGYWHTKERFW